MQTKPDYAKIWRREILPRVQKPARYIGGEWNQIRKNPAQVSQRVVLAFPDVYEIGFSYLGFQILYELLNQNAEFYAERVFSPWPDAEALLRERGLPLTSLETSTPLADFDFVGVTLQHELSYTNVLNLLDLAGLPLERDARTESQPLILGGGPGAANPEPIAEAFDLIVLGDGEQVVSELLLANRELRSQPRGERIRALAKIPGIYAPGLYRPHYSAQGHFQSIEAEPGLALPVRRGVAPAPALPAKPLVPYLGVTHDRLSVELFRGCVRGCRFCQAGMISRPVRERNPQEILEQMLTAVQDSGFEEVSFTSLSSSDYTQLLPLLRSLMQALDGRQIAMSLPSMRLDNFRRELAETIRSVRKTGLTFAPEAGSPRLRDVINKYFDEEGLIQNLAQVFAEGWDLIKLYFMVGLPTETDADVAEINRLVRRILGAARRTGSKRRAPRLNLSVNLFVPKAHTPFQWEPQLSRTVAAARLQQLARELPRAAGFFFDRRGRDDLDRGYLGAVLARGDRRLWAGLKRAWELGARFDSWSEQFRFDLWQQAFRETGLDPDAYALRARDVGEPLPWDHLDTGVSRAYLEKERERALAGQTTTDCRPPGACHHCGARDPKACPLPPASELTAPEALARKTPRPARESVRIRLRYQKTGDMSFVGHLDLVNLFRRAARRARLPLHYSVGFHPQPALSFGPPLPLGFQGWAEWMDLGLDTWRDPREIVLALNEKLPAGVRVEAGREIPLSTAALSQQVQGGEYQFVFPERPGMADDLAARVEAFQKAEEVPGEQWSKRGAVKVNLKPAVLALSLLPLGADGPRVRLLHSTEFPGAAKVTTILNYLCNGTVAAWEVLPARCASGRVVADKIVIP